MHRAFYEWGAIATSAGVLFCFLYWAVSISTAAVDSEVFLPLGYWNSTQILASQGTVTINDHSGSKEAIEEIVQYRVVNPPLRGKFRWQAPGFLYQSVDWGGHRSWSLRLSMLLPALLSALSAMFFIRGYIRVRRCQAASRHRVIQ
jgi:hypothetical protein